MSVQVQGFRTWLLQRLSAVFIGIYIIIVFGYFIMSDEGMTYEKWQQLLSHPAINISLLMFFYAMFLHAWIGCRDIIIDYVKPVSLRLTLLSIIALGIFVMLIWVSLILISVLQL